MIEAFALVSRRLQIYIPLVKPFRCSAKYIEAWTQNSHQKSPSAPYGHPFSILPFQVLYTDKHMVVCAPTGSGKTAVFELAIVRLLIAMGPNAARAKIVYSK